jgi:hypothetical protein
MSYFSLKNRTFIQMALLGLGAYGLFSICYSLLQFKFDIGEFIVSLLLSLGCIWSGTSPNAPKDVPDTNEDILDAP